MIDFLAQMAKVILVGLFIGAVILGSLSEDKGGEDGKKRSSRSSGDNEDQ